MPLQHSSHNSVQSNADKIFSIFEKLNPNPKTELQYTNNFTLLVAVVLSAQSTDISVNKATKELFVNYFTPESFLQLGKEGLKSYIKTIGLYNSKAANILELCRILVEKYHGNVPNSFEELIKLPGVGTKTANVLLNCAFGASVIAVDTHVFRVSRRLGLASAATPSLVEKELNKTMPDKWKRHAHHWLVLHGRYICKARKPDCLHCPVKALCPSAFSI
jgi:endonuclease-3